MNADTGAILRQVNGDGLRYPASLTKMMTLYIVFGALNAKKISMDTHFVVPSYAPHVEPCKLGLRAGERVSVRHLILGLITKSANDASVTLAVGLCGSVSGFAERMNATAQKLGMHQSRFFNPHGLPDTRQLSTAKDMAILSRALIAHFPQYYPLFKTRMFTYKGHCFSNHNKLLGQVEGLDGLKTGWFRRAGSNLAASAIRTINGKKIRLIAVVLGGANRFARDKRIRELLEMGFSMDAERMERAPSGQIMTRNPVMAITHNRKISKNLGDAYTEPSANLLQHEDPVGDLIHTSVEEAHLKQPKKSLYKPKILQKTSNTHNVKPLAWKKAPMPLSFAAQPISTERHPRKIRRIKIIRKRNATADQRPKPPVTVKRIIRRVKRAREIA